MIVFYNGEFHDKNDVMISPDDRGFVFGDGVYEVILARDGRLFKSKEHFKRLKRSLKELSIKYPEIDKLKDVPEKLIEKNNLKNGDATVYIQITRGAAPRKHQFPPDGTKVTVYASASFFASIDDKKNSGVKVILVPDIRWLRCDIKTISLVPNVMACQKAKENGAFEALFVRDGAVTEGTHTSFGAVFDGVVRTYPLTHYILPSITREVVLDLCKNLNIPVDEYPIGKDELKKADECFLMGTTTDVMPVIRVDDLKVGTGKPGPITKKLQKALFELI